MLPKLLVVSGPTATGKTSLAVSLAQKFNGELISADSRQIYRGMDIGTGKDHPKNIPLHLIDIINPDEPFSVAQYQKLALDKIHQIQAQNKLAILVGGTGLYIDSLINPQRETFSVPPKPFLRRLLGHLSAGQLARVYSILAPRAYQDLNNSEKHNPQRLIRKIEIHLFWRPPFRSSDVPTFDYLHLSLTAPNKVLYARIDKRVKERLNNGLLSEISTLLKHYSWSAPGLNTLAYKEFKPYFQKPSPFDLKQATQKWRFDEHAYARRQKTWFKKASVSHFLDITSPDYPTTAFKLVSAWCNINNHGS